MDRQPVLTRPTLRPRSYSAVSPSLYEVLRDCHLRAAFASDRQFRSFDPATPASVIGVVCHEIFAAVSLGEFSGLSGEELRKTLEERWESELQSAVSRANEAGAPVTPADPAAWPRYQIKRARMIDRAFREAERRSSAPAVPSVSKGLARVEADFSSPSGIRGRPDLIVTSESGTEIVDFKTGILVADDGDGRGSLKDSFRRQLLLYAWVVHDVTGEWPVSASVEPLSGDTVSFAVEPQEATAVADDALKELRAYNEEVERGDPPATPSATACQWCPFKVACPAFYGAVSEDWDWRLGAFKGPVTGVGDLNTDETWIRIAATNGSAAVDAIVVHGVPSKDAEGLAGADVAVADCGRRAFPTDWLYDGRAKACVW